MLIQINRNPKAKPFPPTMEAENVQWFIDNADYMDACRAAAAKADADNKANGIDLEAIFAKLRKQYAPKKTKRKAQAPPGQQARPQQPRPFAQAHGVPPQPGVFNRVRGFMANLFGTLLSF
jgi:hypothetical protein